MQKLSTTTALKTIHLQGIGKVAALPAQDLKIGHVVLWNYGGASKITKIEPVGKSSIRFTFEQLEDGLVYERTKRATTLLGVRESSLVIKEDRYLQSSGKMDTMMKC